MAESSHITQTLDEFKQDLSEKLKETLGLLLMINHLEDRLGLSRTTLGDVVPGSSAASQPTLPSSTGAAVRRQSGSLVNIRPDQFLGKEPLDAAKTYIGMVGHAVHFDEIADAVQKGGAAIKGSDWRDKLEVSLVRSVYEVVKVQEKTFGLISFYSDDQIKRLRFARARPEPAKKKRAKKGKPKSNQKPRGDKDEAASD